MGAQQARRGEVVDFPKRKRRRRRRPTKEEIQSQLSQLLEEKAIREAHLPMTVRVTAGAIPALAAMLGWISAEVMTQGSWLATFPAVMTIAALSVSLPHVAKGLRRELQCSHREAWALAITVDLAMVVCEMVLHFAAVNVTTELVCWAVMAMGLVGSTAYNIAGFRRK